MMVKNVTTCAISGTYSSQMPCRDAGRHFRSIGIHNLYVPNQNIASILQGDAITGSPEVFARATLRWRLRYLQTT